MREVLERLIKGEVSIDEAERLLKANIIIEVQELAKLDVGRGIRKGVPEIVLAEGKEADELVLIAERLLEQAGRVIISRTNPRHIEALNNRFQKERLEVYEKARMVVIKKMGFSVKPTGGRIGVITAGTSDIPVAEEARIVAKEMGCEVYTAYDVGVAGVHRVFHALKEMVENDVDVLVVVAGREGALPSVVTSLVDVPVVGIPTSIGYGLGRKGLSALTAMLQSCALGLAVVNIDGGVSAGAMAALIANRVARYRGFTR